jgi:hypothetical protein
MVESENQVVQLASIVDCVSGQVEHFASDSHLFDVVSVEVV